MNSPFTITVSAEDIEASEAYFKRRAAEQVARETRLAEKRRLTRTKNIQKVFADVMRFEPSVIIAEATRSERFYGYDSFKLASIPTYITVIETLLRLAIETAGYRGPQDSDDADAVRVHATQELQARRGATRDRNKKATEQAYRAKAVARELADPRISASHKTRVASGEVEPILVTEAGKVELDWNLVGPAMAAVTGDKPYRPFSKLWATLTFAGDPIKTDWITALPKDTLILFIDAAPDYIAYLQEVLRLACPGHGTPQLRIVP